MSGRAFILIMFFWAVLTLVTPTLIRLSASAKPTLNLNGKKGAATVAAGSRYSRGSLPRRALVATPPPVSPSQPLAPAPEPTAQPQTGRKRLVEP
ncbi:uncharacterized protein LOC127807806 [Diospyros lotus]|uniref:uncharacterized protein LOC127807806 n=1 Tax=Diospyros lotus TaxID=55363 RepID=UPI00225C0009|nr:uncharacterized protein LOC127807806 [Diospyros lotus]